MTSIFAEVKAEDVISAMNEDTEFALDMWTEIAEGLNKGSLLDNACDLLRSIPVERCFFITENIKMLPDFLADHIDHEINKETD